MKKIIFCLMVLMMFSFIAGQGFNEYYKIELNYDKGELKLINLDIEFSDTLIENYFGFYLAKVISYKNESLNSTFFDVPNKILYDEVDENGTFVGGGLLELDEINFTIYAPYYENAKEIIIYNGNLTEKLRIDVSMYSKVSKEELIGKGIIREKGKETIEEEKTLIEKLAKNWWILIIILLILVIILIRGFKQKE